MTINAPNYIDRFWTSGTLCPFDEIIDVRSPKEFADDHIPSAMNLPVLDDAERADVGRIYHEIGAFEARKVGAAIISRNIARFVHGHFAGFDKSYRPFLYCWRGGLRSASLATVLSQIGWRTSVLNGGYRTYRTHVIRELETVPARLTFRIIAGATGTGKTKLLHLLASRGHQILDLELLARHRGSILGDDGGQPGQRMFESLLLDALVRFDPSKPVWVESESRRIGNRYLPPSLWRSLQESDGILIRVPTAARVAHLIAEYEHLIERPQVLSAALKMLAPRRGSGHFEHWTKLIESREWSALVESLLDVHYDPGYERSLKRHFPRIRREVLIHNLQPDSLEHFWTTVEEFNRPAV
jgi:tRNA 2-selenouridine synthase